MQSRTHTCGELRVTDAGKRVKICGWMENVREVSAALAFVVVRDFYGTTQVVAETEEMVHVFKGITRESTISVEGVVRERASKNPNMPTGDIEVVPDKVEVLGKCQYNELPFQINRSREADESTRLKYRYLDLRNPEVKNNIILRSNVIAALRRSMTEHGFMEITTPILTVSSPEGARDYLVPARNHPGRFYALPQAPQQFKQLLMASGFDKYFQIAPCFRDEDARADRSPGEFYQLDFEMAFATQEDVFTVAEQVLYDTFTQFGGGRKVSPAPFRRIPYEEAMLHYGTDKPDLRNPLLIEDLSDFFMDVDFKPFQNRPVRGVNVPDCARMPKSFFEKMLAFAMEIGMKGLGYLTLLEDGSFKGPIAKFLTDAKKQELIDRLSMKAEDTLFFISDNKTVVDRLAGQIRTALGERMGLVKNDSFELCYITDFPMYEKNDEGKLDFTHNPFSMPQGGLEALETMNPLEIKAYQYDIVCNGVELSSGAVRNHRPDIMVKAFELAGYTAQDVEARFGALYHAFQYGAPPHAGMAPGIDRMLMLLRDEENIREVIAFPMNANAQDLLLGAPGEVTEQQLREVHIRLRRPLENRV